MSKEKWWNDTDREQQKYSEKPFVGELLLTFWRKFLASSLEFKKSKKSGLYRRN